MTLTYEESVRWTEYDGTRLHSNESGSGPALICLHGGGPGANAWDNSQYIVDGLARNFETILLDLPGYGRSDELPSIEGESDDRYYARSLIAFLDARGIGSAHFFGTSMSTNGVLRLAIDHPERVGGLVLKAPASMPSWFTPFPTPGLAALFQFMKEQTRDNMEALMRAFVPREEFFRQEMVDVRLAAAARRPSARRSGTPVNLLGELTAIRAPALLLAGRDDRMVPFEGVVHLLGALHDTRMHVWGGGTGHFPEWEHPDEFVELVTDFLRSA